MRQIWKWILGGVGGLVILALLIVGGYAVYLLVQYERIPDGQVLTVEDSPAETLEAGQTYTALTWNVGFGAYSHDFSFFMDPGTMLDGTKVQGTGSRAESRAVVETNVGGAAKTLSDLQPDLILLDIMLPEEDGLSILHLLRQTSRRIGVTTWMSGSGSRISSRSTAPFTRPISIRRIFFTRFSTPTGRSTPAS